MTRYMNPEFRQIWGNFRAYHKNHAELYGCNTHRHCALLTGIMAFTSLNFGTAIQDN